MASFWTIVEEALVAYWTSPVSLGVVVACGTAMATLTYVFLTNARNAKLRVSLLTGLDGLSIFFWAFVAISLILCVSQARRLAYTTQGVPLAAAGAVLGGLAASVALSYLVWRYGNAAVVRRFAPRELERKERWLQDYADLVTNYEGIAPVRIGVVASGDPVAMAVGGHERRILLSKGLVSALEPDELEPVMAHEIMHLKHHDAEFKVFSRVISRVLFFDPFSKFFNPAVHREREYLADEAAGRSTGKPASLASALLKIASHGTFPKTTWGLSILGSGRGVFSLYPPLPERVRRLLFLADLMDRGSSQR